MIKRKKNNEKSISKEKTGEANVKNQSEKQHEKQSENSKASWSVYAIVAFALSLAFLLFPVSQILALIFGIIALFQISKKGQRGKWLAISAIIISIVEIIMAVFAVIAMMAPFLEVVNCKSMDCCLSQNSTFAGRTLMDTNLKEMCILSNVKAYSLSGNVDWKICEKHMTTNDTLNFCTALLQNEPGYCQRIVNTRLKAECMKSK